MDSGLDFFKKTKRRKSEQSRLESGTEQVCSVPGSRAGVGEWEDPAGTGTVGARNRKVSGWGPGTDLGGEVGRAGAPQAAAVHGEG